MSTRENAKKIFDGLTEEQLEKFIALFTERETGETQAEYAQETDIEKRRKIFSDLTASLIPMPDLDEEAEKEAYFKEKYGI